MDSVQPVIDQIKEAGLVMEHHFKANQVQATAMAIFVSTLFVLRYFSAGRLKALNGEHTLNMEKLNSAVLFKEVCFVI